MEIARFFPRRATQRDLMYMSDPSLWSLYPFLPLIRRSAVGNCQQLGVLYDAVGDSDRNGPTTVILKNIFLLPQTKTELLALPKIVYDTLDELADDGWVID